MMTTRRAMSLVELLVLMSAASLVLTMSAALLHRAMRTQSESRAFYDAERCATRLARQLRRDAHQATAASVENAGQDSNVFLRLQLADQNTVEYSRSGSDLLRTSSAAGKVSREAFAFPSRIELNIRQEGSRLLLTIVGKPRYTRGAPPPAGDVHVEAILNRNEAPR
jgi:type II secretory pathway component PulJ